MTIARAIKERAGVLSARAIACVAPEAPLLLALLRIVVPLVILVSPEPFTAFAMSARPAALRVAPEGLASRITESGS